MNVAVIGASNDRAKFGNKAVRAYLDKGHKVFPVNLRENEIEGLRVYRSILDIDDDVDVTLVYLPPAVTREVLPEIARKGTRELYLNPGSANADAVAEAQKLGLEPIQACSIIAAGAHPSHYGPG